MVTITTKNIIQEPDIIITEPLKEILNLLDSKDDDTYQNKLTYTYYDHTCTGNKTMTFEEFKSYEPYVHKSKTIQEVYEEYKVNYEKDAHKVSQIKSILKELPSGECLYYRVCPVTSKPFNERTKEDIIQDLKGKWINRPTKNNQPFREYKMIQFSNVSMTSKYNNLILRKRYHKTVADKIINKWSTETKGATLSMKDATLLGIDMEKGSVNVFYKSPSGVYSIQKLMLYANTKGIFYKVRGKKRYYLDLPELEI